MSVGSTILEQLGGRRFLAMTGAKRLMETKNGLDFTLPKYTGCRVNRVKITLTPSDLYDVQYLYVRNTIVRTIAESHGLYADMLCSDFTRNTGLSTHL